jgi:two-component sensor histidine kinase
MKWQWPSKKAWFWLGLYAVPWILLALLSSAGAYMAECNLGQPLPVSLVLRQEFKSWFACGLISTGVLWFCGRNRLQRGHLARWILVHCAAAVVFSALYAVVASWWIAGEKSVMHPGTILTFSYLVRSMGIQYSVMNLVLYWLVVFGHFGWHFYQRYHERELEAAQLQRELVEARLDALRMQINPHFLFNTLHAISGMIHENPEAADRMVARLSDLLRLSLDSSKAQEVPLNEELAFLDGYLGIAQARFSDRLTIEQEIEPQVRTALVPSLILQPLVENALKYAIEPREDSGQICIRASRQNGNLLLSVTDNGAGLPEGGQRIPREGIGLSNTRSRLRHLYGDKGRLELANAPGGGLEARIQIPYQTETQREITCDGQPS